MCPEEEMPENSVALTGPGKEEQTPSIPPFPRGSAGGTQPAVYPQGRSTGENEATSLCSRGKQIPSVVHCMQKNFRSCLQSSTGPG